MAVCQRSYTLLVEQAGFSPADIILDPNVLTIGTGLAEHGDYAKNYLLCVQWIKVTTVHSALVTTFLLFFNILNFTSYKTNINIITIAQIETTIQNKILG